MSLPALVLLLVRALPASQATLLTRLLILLYLVFKPSCRTEIRHNYRIVMGRGRRWFWLVNGWRTGRNLALMARMGSQSGQFLIDKAEVRQDNRVQLALEQYLHTVMVSFHFGAWEFLPSVFRSRGHDVALIVGAQRDAVLDGMMRATRIRSGARLMSAARELAGNGGAGIVGFMLDNTSRARMVTAESGGVRMQLPGPAFRVAQRSGDGVVPIFSTVEHGRLHVRVCEPGDEHHALACLLAEVRQRPEEWLFWGKAGALETA